MTQIRTGQLVLGPAMAATFGFLDLYVMLPRTIAAGLTIAFWGTLGILWVREKRRTEAA